MIQISKVDEKLKIYEGKEIIIFGVGNNAWKIVKKFQFFNIKIYGFCDSDESKWGKTVEGKKVLSLKELEELNKKKEIVVQIASIYEREIEKQLLEMGIKEYIYFSEAQTRLTFLRAKRNIRNPIEYSVKKDILLDMQFEAYMYSYLQRVIDDEGIILCLPPKTGDFTISNTLERNYVDYCNLWHRPYIFNKKLLDDLNIPRIKIVTAVRDPIAQNISWVFQMIENGVWYFDLDDYWKQGGDVQKIFDATVNGENYGISSPMYEFPCIYDNIMQKGRYMGGFIQNFFEAFSESFFDLTSYEFDKDKGYSIIHDGKLEIFIYQIEKLDSIADILLDWLGCRTGLLENGNIGSEKWYAGAYKQAKAELKLTEEYVEKCYKEPYVTHFYNDSDIEIFKNKWRRNIR